MQKKIRRTAVTAAAGILLGSLSLALPASTASADQATPSKVSTCHIDGTEVPVRTELTGIKEVTSMGMAGPITLLRLADEPDVSPGGHYYLYDPIAGETHFFLLGGDVAVHTTGHWRGTTFFNRCDLPRLEVRYGDVDRPAEGVVLGTVTNTRV